MSLHHHHPIAAGVSLAVLAALSFGVTTPLVARFGTGLGALTTAALLYAGASASSLLLGRVARSSGAPIRGSHLLRLVVIAIVGAGIAPTLFAWGLQRSGAASGSLLLNLEAVFTVMFAWALYREPIGSRVATALTLMALGGVFVAVDAASALHWSGLGALAVIAATAAWALDNTLSRGLAEQDPVLIVAGKGAFGAVLTGSLATALGEPRPTAVAAVALLLCGATGYGLSLRLYLLAQRRIGAARTGSVFALAPFTGAALAWAMGDPNHGGMTLASAALFGVGVYLHVTERHGHAHSHPAEVHEHAHLHGAELGDGHHYHEHCPPFVGEHTHVHGHQATTHAHEHAPDLHHDHVHP